MVFKGTSGIRESAFTHFRLRMCVIMRLRTFMLGCTARDFNWASLAVYSVQVASYIILVAGWIAREANQVDRKFKCGLKTMILQDILSSESNQENQLLSVRSCQMTRAPRQMSAMATLGHNLPILCVFVISQVVILTIVLLFIRLSSDEASQETLNCDMDPQQTELSKCHEYSPSYPSAGGPGCYPECQTPADGSKNFSFGVLFDKTFHNWPDDLIRNMNLAAEILKRYGPLNNLDTERSIYLHVTFDYYCCYTTEQTATIGDFLLEKFEWKPHVVWFDRLVCAIYGVGDMVALVLKLDENSQKSLLEWALRSEKELEENTGIHKRIPHTELQEFHMTLATVNQSLFPVKPAVDEINRTIPPGKWHSSPVVLHKPVTSA